MSAAAAELFRAVFDQSTVGSLVLTPAGDGLEVVEANPAAATMLGRDIDDLRGRASSEASHEQDRVRILDAAGRLVAGTLPRWEAELELRDTPVRWVRMVLTALPDDGGRPLLLAQLADRTAEHEARGRFESVLRAATGTSIVATDRTGTIVFLNSGAEQMLGYSADQVVGVATPALFHDPEELRARAGQLGVAVGYEAVLAPVRAGAELERRDWTFVRASGDPLRVSLAVSAMHDAAGELTGFLGVAEDVTDYHQAGELLRAALVKERQAVDRLQALDRAKTDFVSSVSHELRTPLTTVLGFTEVLLSGAAGELNERQTTMLLRVEQNGGRLLHLIEDLLTLSRIEAGSFRIERSEVDLVALVRRAVRAAEPLLAGRELDIEIGAGQAAVTVPGDADQLERVVVNLLTNAVKFTPDGGRIAVTVESDQHGGTVHVSDTGLGVPAAEQEHLFTRFFRSSTAYDRAIPGTGLGLSIVKSIVDGHGGSVSFDSEPARGSRFSVRLPIR